MNRRLELKRFSKKLGCMAIVALFLIMGGLKADTGRIYHSRATLAADSFGVNWFQDGIILGADILFGTPLPIGTFNGSQGIDLNDGTSRTLTLTSDISLGNGALINASGGANTGTIDGSSNGAFYALSLTGSAAIGDSTTITVQNLTIDGEGNVLDLNNGVLAIAAGTTLTIRNAVLRTVTAGSFTWGDATSKLVLDNVIIELTGNLAFATGDIDIYGNVLIAGGSAFTQTSGDIVVQAGAVLVFDDGTTFDVNGGSFSNNGALYFNGCTLDIAGADLNLSLAAGSVLFENRVVITGANTFNNANVGSATKVLSGATVELQSGAILNLG